MKYNASKDKLNDLENKSTQNNIRVDGLIEELTNSHGNKTKKYCNEKNIRYYSKKMKSIEHIQNWVKIMS